MKVIIFGGSGFIGKEVATKLLLNGHEVKIVCQNVEKGRNYFGKLVEVVNFDVLNLEEVRKHIQGFDVTVNCIGKLFERRRGEFQAFHADFPKLLAQNFSGHIVHVSSCGIGKSSLVSKYASTKLEGENYVKQYAKSYNIISPSVVFGKDDNFFNQFAKMARVSPFLPLIGGGKTVFQPIWVEDVARAVVYLCENRQSGQNYVACGESWKFKEILQFVCRVLQIKRGFVNIPFGVATVQAQVMNLLGIYALTKDQVSLLKCHNIKDEGEVGIEEIIGTIAKVEEIVPFYL